MKVNLPNLIFSLHPCPVERVSFEAILLETDRLNFENLILIYLIALFLIHVVSDYIT